MASPSSSSSKKKKNLLLLLLLLFIIHASTTASSSFPSIGVSFNPSYPGLPSSDRIVPALTSTGIKHVHLLDPDPKTLRSFLYTDTSLLLSLSPSNLPLPLNRSLAHQWLSTHILPFHPRIHIQAISILLLPQINIIFLPESLQILRSACLDLGLPTIPISAVHSFHHLMARPSYFVPPSAARFQPNLTHNLRPILEFLSSTGSPFLVDISPFHLWRANHPNIPIGFALFKNQPFAYRDDPNTGLRYRNLFDAMLDALFYALEDLGFRHLQVVVVGTGWPTKGAKEAAANVELACTYNRGLVQHLRSGLGTPMRREGAKAVYVRELFDDLTGMPEWERHWGIWFSNLTHKYELGFSVSGSGARLWAGAMVHCCWLMALFFFFFFFFLYNHH